MKLTDISYIKNQMEAHGVNFKKKFGQNFLTNPRVVERIAENAAEGVLEIGPGLGVLTAELCRNAKKVVAVEIDETIIPLLKENTAGFDNLKIINTDVLKLDIKKLIDEEFEGCESVSVCANLPYYITTPVIMALAESEAGFESITVMIQKEVVTRLCARPGNGEYGAITASLSYYGKCEKLFDVSAGNFIPKPKVDSAVMRIELYSEPPVDTDRKMLMKVIRGAFSQRRKTLVNSLGSEFSHLNKAELTDIITEAGFAPDIRGEKLSLEDFAKIADIISRS
ncbi:MAG: 16S rRNA (adenine(1518)-N(6)/adenine(1519)-N(6))-dimethyltransferase RsmA [Ruminococcaceae bacterium]|nr:16S rRNA (adenine(1518)-N(6)/adenine(1519)-N(6))-dimethyltransferase RsmA [Oscillospiraceae bacterium]